MRPLLTVLESKIGVGLIIALVPCCAVHLAPALLAQFSGLQGLVEQVRASNLFGAWLRLTRDTPIA